MTVFQPVLFVLCKSLHDGETTSNNKEEMKTPNLMQEAGIKTGDKRSSSKPRVAAGREPDSAIDDRTGIKPLRYTRSRTKDQQPNDYLSSCARADGDKLPPPLSKAKPRIKTRHQTSRHQDAELSTPHQRTTLLKPPEETTRTSPHAEPPLWTRVYLKL